MMTTYVLGAGASAHAGYPVTSQLWPGLVNWANSSPSTSWESQRAIQKIIALNGPVHDLESVLTDLHRGQGAFSALDEEKREQAKGGVRKGITGYFRSIREANAEAPLYAAFTRLLKPGEGIVSFNYDVALEQQLDSCAEIPRSERLWVPGQLGRTRDTRQGTEAAWQRELDCPIVRWEQGPWHFSE